MLKTVKGIYQNGQIRLTEIPPDVQDSTQVLITFLDPEKLDPSQLLQQTFWAKVESIRAQMETEGIEVNPDEIWGDARDRSVGREIVL